MLQGTVARRLSAPARAMLCHRFCSLQPGTSACANHILPMLQQPRSGSPDLVPRWLGRLQARLLVDLGDARSRQLKQALTTDTASVSDGLHDEPCICAGSSASRKH